MNPGTAAPVNVEGCTAVVLVDAGAADSAGGGAAAVEPNPPPPPPPKLNDPVWAAGEPAGGGGGALAAGGVVTFTSGIFAALAMYASMVLGELLFWLITMAMPFSQ